MPKQYFKSTWKQLTYFIEGLVHYCQLSLACTLSTIMALKGLWRCSCKFPVSRWHPFIRGSIHYLWGWGCGRDWKIMPMLIWACLCETQCWHAGCVCTPCIHMTTCANYRANCWKTAGPRPFFTSEPTLLHGCAAALSLSACRIRRQRSCCLTGRRWCHGANVGWQYRGRANGTHLF